MQIKLVKDGVSQHFGFFFFFQDSNVVVSRKYKYAISELPCASISKRVCVPNLSFENEFDLHENGRWKHMNGFTRRLVLISRHKITRKWPIEDQCTISCVSNRPRSIYQYSNMAPRLSGQTAIFGVIFLVSKSLLGNEEQKKRLP